MLTDLDDYSPDKEWGDVGAGKGVVIAFLHFTLNIDFSGDGWAVDAGGLLGGAGGAGAPSARGLKVGVYDVRGNQKGLEFYLYMNFW